MKKLLAIFLILLSCASAFSKDEKDNKFWISGRVKEAIGKFDLTDAYILVYDSTGAVRDSIQANMGMSYRNGEMIPMSYFSFSVPRVDSTYVFDITCPGYKTETITYELKNIGKRERSRELPTIFLERAPKMLKELTVTTSKIKFYNKGDTVVYNADAFQLAEGSMLDALIAQLPGVELSDDGQIKVNGEFVESLLLNGKEFLDGNNNLMLENIGAYTVKNVEVYEGQKIKDKRMGDVAAPKVLTMDVKLKKEYSMGWLINLQGGYGTQDRYMAKAFASWFNATTRVTFIGNANNLNDNRKPGKNDTWTPEMMPSGTKEYRMAGIDYNYQDAEDTKAANGDVVFTQSINNQQRTTARTNFLPGGDTYDHSFSNSRDRETKVSTRHNFYTKLKQFYCGVWLDGFYSRSKNSESEISGAFSDEPQYINAEILDALYSDGSPELLQSVINRSKTRSNGWRRRLQGSISPNISYSIPRSEDRISLYVTASYSSEKEELWRDYNINYGTDPAPAVRRRQYIDNTPNHRMSLSSRLSYSTPIGNGYFYVNYYYSFYDKIKDSYMYALDRLEDMGVYGVVPEGYLAVLDPANSYTSRLIRNRHSISPSYMFNTRLPGNESLAIYLRPDLGIEHRHFDYWRNNHSYKLSKTNVDFDLTSIWDCMIELGINPQGEGRNVKHRNMIRYSYRVETNLPEMADMVDVTDDSNPLNIYVGNPNLKSEMKHRHLVRWSYTPHSHPTFNNILYAGYNHTSNALTRGYTYETATGIRKNKMYNVGGNHSYAFTNELNWQFGSSKQFTLSSETDLNVARYADMIGVDLVEPALTKVNNRSISEKFKFVWQFHGQSIQLRCDFTNRHTTSTQKDFNTLDANHVNYGVSGVFKLPAGFGISTDFTCYTRRGYGVDQLDTTDPIWNMRLSYCPKGLKSRWVFMLDGFDLLHKLSNVNYAVTASGRTVSYTNALPRYVLLSVQYRLSLQPKK